MGFFAYLYKMEKRIIYTLIGTPAIGKSTWIKKMADPNNTFVISNDDVAEKITSSIGWTYNDVFKIPPNTSEVGDIDGKYGEVTISDGQKKYSKVSEVRDEISDAFSQVISLAKNTRKNVVIDLTNMVIKDRKSISDKISNPSDIKIAVIFNFKDKLPILKAVSKERELDVEKQGGSKNIPDYVFDRLINNYESPSPEENFDKIIYSNTIPYLKKIANIKELRIVIRKVVNETIT